MQINNTEHTEDTWEDELEEWRALLSEDDGEGPLWDFAVRLLADYDEKCEDYCELQEIANEIERQRDLAYEELDRMRAKVRAAIGGAA